MTSRAHRAGTQVLVMAKAPVPGRVKTRLCPPCTPEQAAAIAGAALADTLDVVARGNTGRRVLAIQGTYAAPAGWLLQQQRGDALGERLAFAFADTARPGTATLLIGMDTPQVTVDDIDRALAALTEPGGPDAVLGPAPDGGWWALGLRDVRHASVLPGITTSTPTTGAETLAALRGLGLRVTGLRPVRDVDTAADARLVAALCPPGTRFPQAVGEFIPEIALSGVAR